LQPVVPWLRQVQWLFVCFAEFIDEDPEEARARGAAVVRRGVVVVAGAGQGEQDLAAKAGGQEHGGMVWYEPGEGWREKDDPHIGVAVGAVVVREPGGGPGDPAGGNDRRAALGVNCQDAAGCVYQVSPCVRLHCACFAGWPEVAPARRLHM
jgi:hypothetical protein